MNSGARFGRKVKLDIEYKLEELKRISKHTKTIVSY